MNEDRLLDKLHDVKETYQAGRSEQRRIDAEKVRMNKANDGTPFTEKVDNFIEKLAKEIEKANE